MIKQLDIVSIKDTDQITWRSDSSISTDGEWSVAGVIGEELLICQSGSVIKIHIRGLELIKSYSTSIGDQNGKE